MTAVAIYILRLDLASVVLKKFPSDGSIYTSLVVTFIQAVLVCAMSVVWRLIALWLSRLGNYYCVNAINPLVGNGTVCTMYSLKGRGTTKDRCCAWLTPTFCMYRSVQGKRPWALKHNSRFWPAWALTWDINSMFVWKLQQWPLEIRHMGAYPGVGACPGHYGICIQYSTHFQFKELFRSPLHNNFSSSNPAFA